MCVTLVAALASPATAQTRALQDPRGDAPARYDITRWQVSNGAERIAGRVHVVSLQPGGYFQLTFSIPGNPDTVFWASSRWRSNGTLRNRLHVFGEGDVDHDIPCDVRAHWRTGPGTIRISFPRDCIQGLHGRLFMRESLGPLPRFQSQDHTRHVRVPQG
jgi:hypothetical protein